MSAILTSDLAARPQTGVGSNGPAPVDREPMRSFTTARRELRLVCDAHGLDQDSLIALLRDRGLDTAVAYLFDEQQPIPSRRMMRRLVRAVEDVLDVQEPIPHGLESSAVRIGVAVRSIFAGLVLAFSTWTVIGSILDQSNAMARETSPSFTLAVLGCALAALALLEAAHIGAVALSTADVSELRSQYPRVYRMHRHIATPALLEEYLAARQVGVVMIVFVIAEVTRTVGLTHLPGTTINLPAFTEGLFQIGAPGALMVLVIGQVAPQLLTARRPARLMNALPMAGAFYVTLGIGVLGLAKPAGWLVAFSKATERIPSARRQRFNDVTRDVQGLGVQTTVRTVHETEGSTSSTTASTVYIYRPGRIRIDDHAASVPVAAAWVLPSAAIHRDGADQDAVVTWVHEDEGWADPTGFAHTVFPLSASPRLGSFQKSDVVRFSTQAVLSTQITKDTLVITEPTKLALMRVILDTPRVPMPPARMVVMRVDDHVVLEQAEIAPRRTDGDAVEFTVTVNYPDPGTVITLDWGKEAGS